MQHPITLLILGVLLVALTACTPRSATTPASPNVSPTATTPVTPQATYAGTYEVTVRDTPAGTVSGTLTLTEANGKMTGSFVAGGNTTELRSVSTTEDGLRVSFYSSEYQTDVDMDLKGAPGAEELSGMTLGSYATVAIRK